MPNSSKDSKSSDGLRKRLWAAGAAVVVVAIAVCWYLSGYGIPFLGEEEASGEKPKPIPVHVTKAETRTVPITSDYTGTMRSPHVIQLRARVTGAVMERPFQPGTMVRQGDLLFRIDPRPFEASLALARAQRGEAEADRKYYEAEVARYAPLASQGYASQERLQEAVRRRAVAESQIHQAEARMADARLNIEYATVQAPFTGQTGITDLNVGDVVTANNSDLVSMTQLSPIYVQLALSATDLETVRVLQAERKSPVVILLNGDGEESDRVATITEIDDRYNPGTGRILVRARLPNEDRRLVPGQFVQVRLHTGTQQRLLVPTVALSANLDQEIIFKIENGKAQPVAVKTGGVYGDRTAILSGLQPGATIATDNVQRLRADRSVSVQDGEADEQSADNRSTMR